MVNTAYALNSYTQTKVAGATNPVDLIIMLYDGAIEFLDKAAAGIAMKKLLIKIQYINKAFAILEELDNSLNFEAGGEIAVNLHQLYSHMLTELVLANAENDSAKLMQITGLLKNLREGWAEIRNKV